MPAQSCTTSNRLPQVGQQNLIIAHRSKTKTRRASSIPNPYVKIAKNDNISRGGFFPNAASLSYVVCTCNDISKLPPEFSRAERFDGIWFLDLPSRPQKDAIWDIYLRLFELDPEQVRPRDDHWTGAEIRACCRLAALLDVPLSAAAQNVVPVAVTAGESVERLRTWATGRSLDAEAGGIYGRCGSADGRPRRKVRRDPSNN